MVSAIDVLIPFFVLLSLNVVVLIIWTTVDTITWERDELEKNIYGDVMSSVGTCDSTYYSVFALFLHATNGISIILACHQAYRSRNVQTDLNESRNIAVAFICIFQAFFFGIPLLIVAERDRPVKIFVMMSMIGVVVIATQLCTFLPIIHKQKEHDRNRAEACAVGRTGWGSRLRRLRAEQKAKRNAFEHSLEIEEDLGSKPNKAILRNPMEEPSKTKHSSTNETTPDVSAAGFRNSSSLLVGHFGCSSIGDDANAKESFLR